MSLRKLNDAGIAHFGLLLVLVLVISGIGFVGYNVYQKNGSLAETVGNSYDMSEAVNCGDSGPLPDECKGYEP